MFRLKETIRRKLSAFTIMELIVVCFISFNLVGLGTSAYGKYDEKTKHSSAQQDMEGWVSGIEQYQEDYGSLVIDTAQLNLDTKEKYLAYVYKGNSAASVNDIPDKNAHDFAAMSFIGVLQKYFVETLSLEESIDAVYIDDTHHYLKLSTKAKRDPWGGKYYIYIDTVNGDVTFVSGGPDGFSDYVMAGTFADSDDKVVTMKNSSTPGFNGGMGNVNGGNGAVDTYAITFASNGGSGTMAKQTLFVDAWQPLATNSFSRAGYTFKGWDTSALGETVIYHDQEHVLNLANNGITTLYAVWEPNHYIIAFDANGGTGSMESHRIACDEMWQLPNNAFTNADYRFAGWTTNADNGVVQYNNGAYVQNLSYRDGAVVTLFAVWTQNQYDVVFHANGGEGVMTNQTMSFNLSQALKSNTFTKTGYLFNGWSVTPEGTAVYDNNETVVNLTMIANGTFNLYATWKPIGYTVAFDANGGEGTMYTQNFVYNETKPLPSNVFYRDGYVFSGWSTSQNAQDAQYNDKQNVTNLVSTDGSNITLYAIWKPIHYKIAFDANGGTGVMDNMVVTYDAGKTLPANTFKKDGNSFLGWSTNSTASDALYKDSAFVKNLTTNADETVKLYAVWKPKTINITFHKNTSADDTTTIQQTLTYGVANQSFAANSWTRTGYTLLGWSDDPDATEARWVGSNVQDSWINYNAPEIDLYAVWDANKYTIQYYANGGNGDMEDTNAVYDKDITLRENAFTKEGYTFIGWNTQADGKGTSFEDKDTVKNLTAKQNDVLAFYAQWAVKTYALRFHANGGEGEMPVQVIEWDKLTPIIENRFTNNAGDYRFAGWATSPDGEVVYLDNQPIINLQQDGTLDLYAVWLLNSYTVTFDYNIGSGSPDSKEVVYGEEYGAMPPYVYTKTENLFTGWYTAAEGGTKVYPEMIVDKKEDHTLWAHWETSPANDAIKSLVVYNSADDNNDGVVDGVALEFKCSSSFEKFNIPLHNLVPGQTYELTYTASNNASFGDYINGYKNARYGSYILTTATETSSNITSAVDKDILATWNERVEADGTNDGSQAAINDEWLNGPWENRTMRFRATAETMYWAWEFGLIEDGILYNFNIYDISLTPVEAKPEIIFNDKHLVLRANSAAKIKNETSSDYATNFVFDGDSYAEAMYYPITGLTAGSTYTITFDHTFSGSLINSSSYDYGCGIASAAPTTYGSRMKNLSSSWLSDTFVMSSVTGNTESVTFTFTANSDTVYWVWNMANCNDSKDCTIDVKVTKFSASHPDGSSEIYYDATSPVSLLMQNASNDVAETGFTNDISPSTTASNIVYNTIMPN